MAVAEVSKSSGTVRALREVSFELGAKPLLTSLRTEMGVDPDPMAAYDRSGYFTKICADRVGGTQAGWGA